MKHDVRLMATKRRPNFFIVGAPKAATSSLYGYLGQHPDVYFPTVKELHYFSYPEVSDTYYDVPFITSESEYLKQYKGMQGERASGDASNSYLHTEAAAQRIRRFDPKAKIIMVLRNPIERAISHYLMDVCLGVQKEALSKYLEKTDANRLFYKEYVEMGMYYRKVKNYIDEFGWEQVLIIIYDDLAECVSGSVERAYRFLDVDASFSPNLTSRRNTYRMPRYRFLSAFNKKSYRERAAKLLPEWLKDYLKRALTVTEKPKFTAEEKRLEAIYANDIDKLSGLLSRDLTTWLNVGSMPMSKTNR